MKITRDRIAQLIRDCRPIEIRGIDQRTSTKGSNKNKTGKSQSRLCGANIATNAAAAKSPNHKPAGVDIDQAFAQLTNGQISNGDAEKLWEKIVAAGQVDEMIAVFEARADANNNDPQAQVDLGSAYLQKLFTVGGPAPDSG